jgi:stringent starvation protein B
MPDISTKPYLLRAIYEWCTDNGYTPFMAVMVNAQTKVPREFVKNGEIVLNISFNATSGLKMDNDIIHFNARFGGVSREIVVPVDNVIAIYAQENGQGMAFEVVDLPIPNTVPAEKTAPSLVTGLVSVTSVPGKSSTDHIPATSPDDNSAGSAKKIGKPTLTRIK